MSLHSFEPQRHALPSWCGVCASLVTPLTQCQVCRQCGLLAHAECTTGLPALCNNNTTTTNTVNNNSTNILNTPSSTPSKVNTDSATRSSSRLTISSAIDNVVLFPPHLRSFFTLGSVREDCWICRSRIAVLRATFPDKTYSLACARCMDTVRRNYALLDSDPLLLPFASPKPTPTAPAAKNGGKIVTPAKVKPKTPNTKKKSAEDAAAAAVYKSSARKVAAPTVTAPTPQPKAVVPAQTVAVGATSSKAKSKAVSFKTPAPVKTSYPVTPSPPAKAPRSANSTGMVKKRLTMSDVTQVKPTTSTSVAVQQPKQQQQQQSKPPQKAKSATPTPTVKPTVKPKQQQTPPPPPPPDNEDAAPDVSREALQYCDAGQRVFDSDARTAVHHFQRAANAQAAELFSRDASPSERARRVLAVCHANVSAARLALNEPQAALDAAAHAIAADSSWSRPFYRQAKSLLALGRAADACSALALARRRFADDESLRLLHRQARRDRLQQNGVYEPNTDDEEEEEEEQYEEEVQEEVQEAEKEEAVEEEEEEEEQVVDDEGEETSGDAYGDEQLEEEVDDGDENEEDDTSELEEDDE
jgi:hypothetical protein